MYAIQLADLLVLHRNPIMRMILPPLLSQGEERVEAGVQVAVDGVDGVDEHGRNTDGHGRIMDGVDASDESE